MMPWRGKSWRAKTSLSLLQTFGRYSILIHLQTRYKWKVFHTFSVKALEGVSLTTILVILFLSCRVLELLDVKNKLPGNKKSTDMSYAKQKRQETIWKNTLSMSFKTPEKEQGLQLKKQFLIRNIKHLRCKNGRWSCLSPDCCSSRSGTENPSEWHASRLGVRNSVLRRQWGHRLPKGAVDAPSLRGIQGKLDGALDTLVWWEVSLPTVEIGTGWVSGFSRQCWW